MNSFINIRDKYASIIVKKDTIRETNVLFRELCGFHNLEGMYIEDFWNLVNLKKDRESYEITAASHEIRTVNIECFEYPDKDEIIYVLKELNNERLQEFLCVLKQMYSNNVNGIGIYSIPDLKLVECNNVYLDFLDEPYNKMKNPIGKTIFEIVNNFAGCDLHIEWQETITRNKSLYLKEYRFDTLRKGIAYWEIILSPISFGNERYLCVIANDVTESVIAKKIIEKQKKELQAIIDNISDTVFIIDRDGNYVNFNNEARAVFFQPFGNIKEIGDESKQTPYYDNNGNIIPFKNIPACRIMRGEKITDYKMIVKDKDDLIFMDVNGTPVYDDDGNFVAGVICSHNITEHVVSQNLIRTQKEELEIIIKNMSDRLLIIDKNEEIIMVNNELSEYFAQTGAINILEDFYKTIKYCDMEGNIIPHEKMPSYRSLRGEFIRNQRILSKYADKEEIIELSASPVFDKYGEISMSVICIRDITDSVRKERIIEEKNKQLETIINNISEFLYVVDKNGQYILLNNSGLERINSKNVKIVSDLNKAFEVYDLFDNRVNPEDFPVSKVIRGEEVKNEVTVTYEPNKRYLSSNAKPVFDNNGDFVMGILTVSDVTKDFLHRQAIERQADALYQIMYNLDLPLLRLSYPDLIVLNINNKAMRIANTMNSDLLSVNDIKYRKVTDIFPYLYNEVYYKYINDCVNEKKTKYLKDINFKIDGEVIHFNIIFEPIFTLHGEIKEIVIVAIDVTSEIEANKIMEKALRIKDEFLANTSHELKTPLSCIIGISEAMIKGAHK